MITDIMISPGTMYLHVAEAIHVTDPRADQAAEDDEVQHHGDRWGSSVCGQMRV